MVASTDPIDTHGHTVADFIDAYGDVVATGDPVTLATSSEADDIIDTAAAHGFAAGDAVVFTALTGGAGLSTDTVYYVSSTSLAAQTFRVAATPGGSALGFTTNITAGTVAPLAVGSDGVPAAGEMALAQSPAEVQAQIDNPVAPGL